MGAFLTSESIPFVPVQGKLGGNTVGLHANFLSVMTDDTFEFVIPLKLNGPEKITFAPFSESTEVKLTLNRNPSSQGPRVPSKCNVTKTGFDATWGIPSISNTNGRHNHQLSLSCEFKQLFWVVET